ncbi:F-box protein At3g07870-like [Papaver somniferum]|uniref:F-box protein At3g07870-like n=1 Tax=Papaver somniferum TaxID=3469 RepID=UPI000E6F855D|nr:F-box protein At3g07870-like [Papaver somniferum]
MEYDSIWYHEEPNEPLYIWNPITREIVALPPIANKNLVSLVHGFGYHPLTKEYKVVRISYRSKSMDAPPCKGKVEVYTVGSGSGWRNVLKIDYLIEPSGENMNNCVNGALHWLKYETGEIVAFDLADEEFHLVEFHLVHTPPGLSHDSNKALSSRIFVMRGCLCLAYEYEFYGDLWMLKKQENAVTSDFYNAKDQYYKSRKWIKEIEIPYEDLNHALKIFGLTKEGAVVLKHEDGSMTLYHPKFNARVGDSTLSN